jgi:peptidoglycan/xylan/chitin deacetylase (PgdA/CDA1 family)
MGAYFGESLAATRHRHRAGKATALVSSMGWVYCLYYHSIPDNSKSQEWERAYNKIATDAADFRAHMDWLHQHMTPLATSDLLRMPPEAFQSRAYFCIHFDDGYTNLLDVALPILREYPVRPTVFVNADFASGRSIYYRVLAAIMAARGQAPALAQALRDQGFSPPNDLSVFDYLKNNYRAGDTEAAVMAAWTRENGEVLPPDVHLNWAQIQQLAEAGWEIGNHTAGHWTLAELSLEEHKSQINDNESQIRAAGFEPLPCLSYPNGAAKFVGANTYHWFVANPSYHGFFGSGGVNLQPTRLDWLRIPVGEWSLKTFIRQVKQEAEKSRRVR